MRLPRAKAILPRLSPAVRSSLRCSSHHSSLQYRTHGSLTVPPNPGHAPATPPNSGTGQPRPIPVTPPHQTRPAIADLHDNVLWLIVVDVILLVQFTQEDVRQYTNIRHALLLQPARDREGATPLAFANCRG